MANDLRALFNMPPEQAIRYLEDKGYQITWNWYDMLGSAQSRAFTVAKATSQDVLQTIRAEVERAIREGMTFDEFKKNLQPRLMQAGWWGKAPVLDAATGELTTVALGSYSRLKTIFQTNMQTAYMAARYRRFEENKNDRHYLAYIAVEDGKTRPTHRKLYEQLRGKVIHIDDPIWEVIFPPNGFNCRCRTMAFSLAEVRRLRLQIVKSMGSGDFVPVILNDEGETAQVQSVQIMGNNGQPFSFRPDPGWDYNPGRLWPADQV